MYAHKQMGLSASKTTSDDQQQKAYCEIDKPRVSGTFELLLDSEAFQYRMLMSVPSVRVSKLHIDGSWISEESYSDTRPYEDSYVRIMPSEHKATMAVDKSNVKYLYNSKQRVQNVLCRAGSEPILFIKLNLKKQDIPRGIYDIPDNSMFLCGNEYILIVNLPDDPKVSPPQKDITVDTTIQQLYLPSRPLVNRIE